jgi:hypothetical protein
MLMYVKFRVWFLYKVTDPPILPQLNYTKPSENIMVIKCKVISREERNRTAAAPILPTDRVIKICVHFALHNATTSTSTISTTLGAEQEILKHTTTRPIQLVNYKFALTQEDEDAEKAKVATTDEEDVWYKDEGGRDKSMVAQVAIVAGNNPSLLPLPQDIPFHTILLYANVGRTGDDGGNQREDVVRNQDILRVFGPAKHYIDAGKGRETLLYRIEEVSKSHQGNMFQLEIRSPADGRRDIAPVRTRPVSVRSKRNKRQRLSSTGIGTNSSVTTAPPVKATATATSTTTPKERDAAESLTNISPTINNPSTEGAAAVLAPSIPTPAAAAAITPVSSIRKSIPARSSAVSTASLPVFNPYTMTSHNFHHPQVSSSTTNNGSYRHNNSNITYPTSTVRLEALLEMKEALNRIHNWVDIVVNNLKSIQWKVIGYDHNPDGSVNFNQPYYNMPNPNSCVANILAM